LEFEREIAKGKRIYIEYQNRPLFGLCENWMRIVGKMNAASSITEDEPTTSYKE
jgi:hypothetical protein